MGESSRKAGAAHAPAPYLEPPVTPPPGAPNIVLVVLDDVGFLEARQPFDELFGHPKTVALSDAWIEAYEQRRVPHPGLTLRDDILPALNLQVGEAAARLGVDRTTLSKVVNGRAAISPAMVLRIERWLGRDHGGAAEVWLAQQAAYDLWQARVAAKASKTLSGIKALRLQTA